MSMRNHELDWRMSSACREADPDIFFPTGHDEPLPRQIARAKSICNECPVVRECLMWALADPLMDGIWGGTTQSERRAIRRRRTAQRLPVVA